MYVMLMKSEVLKLKMSPWKHLLLFLHNWRWLPPPSSQIFGRQKIQPITVCPHLFFFLLYWWDPWENNIFPFVPFLSPSSSIMNLSRDNSMNAIAPSPSSRLKVCLFLLQFSTHSKIHFLYQYSSISPVSGPTAQEWFPQKCITMSSASSAQSMSWSLSLVRPITLALISLILLISIDIEKQPNSHAKLYRYFSADICIIVQHHLHIQLTPPLSSSLHVW